MDNNKETKETFDVLSGDHSVVTSMLKGRGGLRNMKKLETLEQQQCSTNIILKDIISERLLNMVVKFIQGCVTFNLLGTYY